MVRSTSPGSILATASNSPMWVVTWMTLSVGEESIIDTSSVPVRCASTRCGREDVSGGMQGFLVERSGADRLYVAGHCQFACHADVFEGRVACHSGQFAPGQVVGKQTQIDDIDPSRNELGVGNPFDGNDLRLQAENSGRKPQTRCVTDDDGVAPCGDLRIEHRRHDDLGPIPAPSPIVTAT